MAIDFEKDNITHTHNGVGSPKINPRDLKGFPVFTSNPTHTAPQGTIVLVDTGAVRKICTMLGGVWYEEILTTLT